MATHDKAVEAQQQQQKGPETFLTPDERRALQRTLGFPEDLPAKFKSWVTDYLSVNFPEIPISQISGFDKYLYKKGTELPANPRDGQPYAFAVDTSAGIMWRFQYNADSGSTYKWEFVGGSPIILAAEAMVSTTSDAWQNLGGPGSTVPLAGDYLVQFGAEFDQNTADRDTRMGIYNGATSGHGMIVMEGIPDRRIALSKAVKITVASAGATVRAEYSLGSTPGTGTWQRRWIMISPIRVKAA